MDYPMLGLEKYRHLCWGRSFSHGRCSSDLQFQVENVDSGLDSARWGGLGMLDESRRCCRFSEAGLAWTISDLDRSSPWEPGLAQWCDWSRVHRGRWTDLLSSLVVLIARPPILRQLAGSVTTGDCRQLILQATQQEDHSSSPSNKLSSHLHM